MLRGPVCLFCLLLPGLCEAQSIVTVAGGRQDDGRQGSVVSLAWPRGLAVGPTGLLYVVDNGNTRVVSVALRTGVLRRVAGAGSFSGPGAGDGGLALDASFIFPDGVAADRDGNLFVADTQDGRVRRIDAATRVISTVAGGGAFTTPFNGDGGPATQAYLGSPAGVAVDAEGNLLVASPFLHKLRRVDARTGLITTIAGTGQAGSTGDGGPGTQAQLKDPRGVAVDASGNVYVSERQGARVRRVDRSTGLISTVAGGGSPSTGNGDGGPATAARLLSPVALACEPGGGLLIADAVGQRVRLVDGASGVITTLAGKGSSGFSGDGGPATAASLNEPNGVAVDARGNVYVSDRLNHRVRRVEAGTGVISTFAGLGEAASTGDGGLATQASLFFPLGLAVDAAGDLFVADSEHYTVRKVERATGLISKVAGGGEPGVPGDGGPATKAYFQYPDQLAFGPSGELFISEFTSARIRRVDPKTGVITTAIGTGKDGFAGDGGPATKALINSPGGLVADRLGNVSLSASGPARVRQVDAATSLIRTVAGTGEWGFAGDGGPATAAKLESPQGLAVDPAGNLFVADGLGTHRIRRIDAATGVITTVAGGGSGTGLGDGGPATMARFGTPKGLAVDGSDRLYVADGMHGRIRRVDLRSGLIDTVAGGGGSGGGFAGDGGPATGAAFNNPIALAVNAEGDLFVADQYNNRVRAIPACKDRLGPFDASFPNDGAQATTGSVNLAWGLSDSAFRYDVLVDTAFPPRKALASGLSGQAVQVSGLTPGTTYFWQVRARGDPYCPSVPERLSLTRRFTTLKPCSPPAAVALSPAAVSGTTATLAFAPVADAATYDVHLGAGSAWAVVGTRLTAPALALTGLAPGTSYRWRVIARAACDEERTSSSEVATFETPGACAPPGAATLLSPADGTRGLPAEVVLLWKPSPGAGPVDVFLGTSEPLPLVAKGVVGGALPVTLDQGVAYRWRVVSHAACDASATSASDTASVATEAGCAAPPAPGPIAASAGAVAGATYTLTWPGGRGPWVLERSRSADFGSSETIPADRPSVVLAADQPGLLHHRVRAVAPCGTRSAPGSPATVSVGTAPAALVVTSPPRATVIPTQAAGAKLPRLEVEVRNVGGSSFLGFLTTEQRVPFFQSSETVLSLRPGEARVLFLQITGVPADRPGQYEGSVAFVSADPRDATAYPQVPVTLTVSAAGAPAAAPTLPGGEAVRFAPAAAGASPEPVLVDVANPASTPLDLAADVLPDPWLAPEPGWNASPIPPHATRAVPLNPQRVRGEGAGAFPRSTYVTFRTVDGRSARLLVEDSDLLPGAPCRARAPLAASESSLIVPSVANVEGQGGVRFVSRVLLTNLGTETVPVGLFYTPDLDPEVSGYDCTRVKTASLAVPPNDVVALSDPVGRLFAAEGSGQLEIRSSRIGQLRVTSVVDAAAAPGGSFGFQLPTVWSRDGVRASLPHAVAGVLQTDRFRTNLILAETSGEASAVTVTLYDRVGRLLATRDESLGPYGKKQLAVRALLADGAALDAGSLEIAALPGSAGTVAALTTVIDARSGDASSFLARPLAASTRATTFAVPSVVISPTFRSRLEVRNSDTRPATYRLVYRGSTGTLTSAPRTLLPRATDAFADVLAEVFALAPTSFGPLFVEADGPNLLVVSRVSSDQPSGSYGDGIEGIAVDDPLAAGEAGRLLVTDGLEGTAGGDRSRGARTNLLLTEVAGGRVEVEVALWDKSQRRVAPASRDTYVVGPHELLQLNDVFDALGIGQRDRLNALCTVTVRPGSTGRVVALATRIDNRTQDTKNLVARP